MVRELVSIIIPAYNAERWIGKTIESALSQDWPRKEIIIVDDGSTDKTLRIAKKWESKCVMVISQENGGASAARNKGLACAQGDYIQWLDADDLLHPGKITRQLDKAGSGRTSLTLLTCEWGAFFFRHRKAKFTFDPLWRDLGPLDWIMTRFIDHVWMHPAVWLVSRRLTDLAGPWDERLSSDDDGEYVCRVAAASDGVRFVQGARCYYRIGNGGSLSRSIGKSDKSLESLALSMRLCVQHLRSLEDSERTRKAGLKHLHNFIDYFYAADECHFEHLNEVANGLGGDLRRSRVSWKYYPFEKTLGPRATKNIIAKWRAAKLLVRRDWDELMYRLVI